MKLYLIRHAMTGGNLEKRYVGRTDEGLCREGVMQIQNNLAQQVYAGIEQTDLLFVSPMRRCTETADLLLPHKNQIAIPAFREIDFGRFEGKNYQELTGDALYQQWIDSGGRMAFPEGESREDFIRRCQDGMKQAIAQAAAKQPVSPAHSGLLTAHSNKTLSMIVHGGTIMALLSTFGEEDRDYYDYQCENGRGFACQVRECHIQKYPIEKQKIILRNITPL